MSAAERALELARTAARAADDKKATELVALDVSEHFPLADIFLVASGSNERQVVAIAEAVEDQLLQQGVKARRREGMRGGRWALLDFDDVIVHVMHEEERAYYQVERLWKDCPTVPLELDA